MERSEPVEGTVDEMNEEMGSTLRQNGGEIGGGG